MPKRDDSAVSVDLYDDVLLGAVRKVYQDFRVALPGIVQTFARETTRVAVAFGTRFRDMARGVRDEPPVGDLPVILPRAGGYGFHADMREGDLGIVIACDGPVRGLYETGEPTTPQFVQGHDYGCAVVLPGGRVSSSNVPTAPPNAAGTLLVGADDGSAAVVFRGAGIPSPTELGSVVVQAAGPTASVLLGSDTAAVPVACAPQVTANFDALNTMIQALPVVPGDPGVIAALKTGFQAWASSLQSVADAKVRVEGPV